jgi:lipoyl(octanoyl) transferase
MPSPPSAAWRSTFSERDLGMKEPHASVHQSDPARLPGPCWAVDLGRIGYQEAVRLQQRLVAARQTDALPDLLLLCEHPHVITQGRNGKSEHLLASASMLRQMGVEFHATNRGGDITYHGPGQVVGYPILQLGKIRRDVVWYVRRLEEAMMDATAAYGVAADRVLGCTGVWVRPAEGVAGRSPTPEEAAAMHGGSDAEKLGAIGVHISRWVTSHGFAYNLATDLAYFDLIVPCGLAGRRATSLEKLLGRRVPRHEFLPRLVHAFGNALGLTMQLVTQPALHQALAAAEQGAAPASAVAPSMVTP